MRGANSARQRIAPDTEAVEDRGHRAFQIAHRGRAGIERRQYIDQHDLAIQAREMIAVEWPHDGLAVGS